MSYSQKYHTGWNYNNNWYVNSLSFSGIVKVIAHNFLKGTSYDGLAAWYLSETLNSKAMPSIYRVLCHMVQ